ncbi:MAG: hypothetical protein ACI86C_000831 [Candidatus Latescibacterota bacterium]|jgi:hypothetical protein
MTYYLNMEQIQLYKDEEPRLSIKTEPPLALTPDKYDSIIMPQRDKQRKLTANFGICLKFPLPKISRLSPLTGMTGG